MKGKMFFVTSPDAIRKGADIRHGKNETDKSQYGFLTDWESNYLGMYNGQKVYLPYSTWRARQNLIFKLVNVLTCRIHNVPAPKTSTLIWTL